MKKQLFPKEFLKHSVEVHQFKYSQRSRNIYWTLLFFLLFVILALPLVKVNVYTTVRGIIKPEKERQVLRVNSSGQVIHSQLSPNASVERGDTLLGIAQPVLEEKKRLLNEKIKEHQNFLNDLAILSQNQASPQLNTPTYQKQWHAFKTIANELSLKKTKVNNDLKRAKSLFKKGIIPKVEWENVQHEHALVLSAEEQFLREILVMKNGKVIEVGNHLDLIEKEGVYYQLWQQQMII